MYAEIFTHYPALGKAAELRSALEERARAETAAGSAHLVGRLVYADEPAFMTMIRHKSLAAVEVHQNRRTGDPAFQSFLRKSAEASARAPSMALYEYLVPATASAASARFALWRTFQPAPGKAGELRAAVEKRAHTPSPGALGKIVYARVLGPGQPPFVLNTLFASLADLETYLKAQPTDPAVQAFVAQVAGLSVSGGHAELYRVLLPFPS